MSHWESCECRKCDQKRIADLREENERLRDALRQIITHEIVWQDDFQSLLTELADKTGASIIARKALRQAEGGDDDE